jgi:hypothetical protein
MIGGLSALVVDLVTDGVLSREEFHDWKRGKEDRLRQYFDYHQREGMPDVTQIVAPHFHAELPLIGLNYTPAAGISLHHYDGGWSPALRCCRGIVFDHLGNVVGRPWQKFQNYGERGGDLPLEPHEVTVKLDGHLLIIFRYGDYIVAKTRGDFDSGSAQIGKRLVKDSGLADRWHDIGLHGVTVLCELIHPETKVTVDYGARRSLTLIGLLDHDTGSDLPIRELRKAGDALGLETVAEVKLTRDELLSIPEQSGNNAEGYVVRGPDGHRCKLKFLGYIEENREQRLQRKAQRTRPELVAGVGRRPRDAAIQGTALFSRQPVRRR